MGRKRKQVRQQRKPDESDYDSDDERAYKKMGVPDPKAPDYWMDEVDEFNEKRDKILLDGGGRQDGDSDSEDQEEILGLDYSDSDDDDLEEKLRHIKTQQQLDEMASDVEEEDEAGKEAGIPDAKAWGKHKKEFYNTDYVDDDLPGMSGSDEEAAQEDEEREALAIQKRMTQMMQETDFDLQLFQGSAKPLEKKATDGGEEKVVKDLSRLSKREKLEILKKESPEFLELVGDFKAKLQTVIDTLYPLLGMVKDGRIPDGPGADYINTRFKLYMNYCVNISFYMTLKAKRIAVHNHPVIGRILAHKRLIKELEPLDLQLESEMKELLSGQETVKGNMRTELSDSLLRSGSVGNNSDDDENITTQRTGKNDKADFPHSWDNSELTSQELKAVEYFEKSVQENKQQSLKERKKQRRDNNDDDEEDIAMQRKTTKDAKRKKKKMPSDTQRTASSQLTSEEQKALEYYEKLAKEVEEKRQKKKRQKRDLEIQDGGQEDEQVEESEDGKRAITYQISKNKGLTPHRKKEQRNPRVKHRMKYKKAQVRRKGQVREVRTEMTRYGGEASGIRAGVIKSIKIR